MKDKMKRGVAALVALAVLALGGTAIAGAASGGSSSPQATKQSEAAEAPGKEAAEGPDQSEAQGSEQDNLSGPNADRAKAAAEKATSGKAVDVSAADAASEKKDAASEKKDAASEKSDGTEQQEFNPPANTAYEVAVANGSKEVDVYLDKDFQVITTHADSEQN